MSTALQFAISENREKICQSIAPLCNATVKIQLAHQSYHLPIIDHVHIDCAKEDHAEDKLWLREGMLFPFFQSATEGSVSRVSAEKHII